MHIQINSKFWGFSIGLFPLIFAFLIIWLRKNHLQIYETIGLEDHIIEYSQFFFFLAGGIGGLLLAFKLKKHSKIMFGLFLTISIVLIFIAGEEISWGERILGANAPEPFNEQTNLTTSKYNVQGERNLHNFEPVNNIIGLLYLIIGGYFVFAWLLVKIVNKFFNLTENIKKYLPFLIPSPILILYFVPTAINLLDRDGLGIKPQDYEMAEFLFSLGILIFIISCYLFIRKKDKPYL